MATILRDIVDFVKDIDSVRKDVNNYKSNTKSIAKLASDAILQFPVICSKGISVEGMSLVTKALERQYSSFMLILTSLYNTIDYNKTPIEYLK